MAFGFVSFGGFILSFLNLGTLYLVLLICKNAYFEIRVVYSRFDLFKDDCLFCFGEFGDKKHSSSFCDIVLLLVGELKLCIFVPELFLYTCLRELAILMFYHYPMQPPTLHHGLVDSSSYTSFFWSRKACAGQRIQGTKRVCDEDEQFKSTCSENSGHRIQRTKRACEDDVQFTSTSSDNSELLRVKGPQCIRLFGKA